VTTIKASAWGVYQRRRASARATRRNRRTSSRLARHRRPRPSSRSTDALEGRRSGRQAGSTWPGIIAVPSGDYNVHLPIQAGHAHRFAAASISAMTMASMFRSSRMARSLNFSASSRRSSSVRMSRTCSGTADGLARRAMARFAASAGSRTVRRRFGTALSGSSGWSTPERSGRARRLDTGLPALH